MKRMICLFLCVISILGLSVSVSAASVLNDVKLHQNNMFYGLLILAATTVILLVVSMIVTASHPFSRKRRGAIGPFAALVVYLSAGIQIGLLILCIQIYRGNFTFDSKKHTTPDSNVSAESSIPLETESSQTTEETVPPTTTEPPVLFIPAHNADTDPANYEINWEILVDGQIVDSYIREDPISMGRPEEYFALPGMTTFRGNNYRNQSAYGTADISSATLTRIWKHSIGSYNNWGGCAWTGQPLLVQWDAETRQIMNLHDSKKNKEGLIEVVYGTLDGNIHFYDIEDGSETRDPIFMSMNFKGAGALDPRGYPILYIGGGLYVGKYAPRMYAVSLIDGSILWEYGQDDADALRGWTAFDSSPLLDAETDTLIWPGESGVLYTVKLNTNYDKANGTLSMNPDTPVKTRYSSTYSEDGRYLGYESSGILVDSYYYVGDNAGLFHCIDINTMELIWTQDVQDDINATPVFEWEEEGVGYIYLTPSLDYTAKNAVGSVSIYKIDASTGEIVWAYPIECVSIDGISGGALASPILGMAGSDIEDLIIYSIGRTPTAWKGSLFALDKHTGEIVWETETGNYAWSSPLAFYTDEGESYIFTSNASGVSRMIKGENGEILNLLDLDQTVEASPVAFGNYMVLGTREAVYAFKIN